MRISFFRLLVCPYCGSDFRVATVIEKKLDEIVSGIVKCVCSEFPVLEGILILNRKYSNREIVELIKERQVEEATIRVLGWDNFELLDSIAKIRLLPSSVPPAISSVFGRSFSRIAKSRAERKYRRLYKKYSDRNLSFCDLLGDGPVETYLKHRFSADSFWSLYPFLPILKKKKKRILDLNCGAGHASFVISQSIQPAQICCADYSFNYLNLARKYFVKNAEFVCIDANYHLPFKDGIFSSILMSDAFHYIHSHVSLVNETERILFSDGLLLLLHVHNSLANNRSAGYPLTPKETLNLFRNSKLKTKIFSEMRVVEDFLFDNKLELAEEHTEDELNLSNSLILLATSDKMLLTTYEAVNRDFLRAKSNLIINPIYKMTAKDGQVLLKRPRHKYSLGDSYPISEKYLPIRLRIRKEFVSGRYVFISNLEILENLMKKFVVINVPEKYISPIDNHTLNRTALFTRRIRGKRRTFTKERQKMTHKTKVMVF